MKVIGWISWAQGNELLYNGTMVLIHSHDWPEIINAVRDAVTENHLVISPHDHQHWIYGVPVFNCGCVLMESLRGWGSVLSQIYEPKSSDPFAYVKYYLEMPTASNHPQEEYIN